MEEFAAWLEENSYKYIESFWQGHSIGEALEDYKKETIMKSVKIDQVYELRTTGELVKVIKECNGYYLAVEYDYDAEAWATDTLMVTKGDLKL